MGGDSVFYNTSVARKGQKGSKVLPPLPRGQRSRWKRGTSVEVAWGVRYNHGGGYSYRLCPADKELTEECFQAHHLEFDRDAQMLKWNDGKTTFAMGDKAIFVDGDVTYPRGSTWARVSSWSFSLALFHSAAWIGSHENPPRPRRGRTQSRGSLTPSSGFTTRRPARARRRVKQTALPGAWRLMLPALGIPVSCLLAYENLIYSTLT